jgi:hypothetical protein
VENKVEIVRHGGIKTAMPCKIYFFLVTILLLFGCATTPVSTLLVRPVGQDETLYFIPPSEWTAQTDKTQKISMDITYHSMRGESAVCNISLYETQNVAPELVSVTFSDLYSVEDIETMFYDESKKELRITSKININALIEVLETNSIYMKLNINGQIIIVKPPEIFLTNSRRFIDLLK